MLGGFGVTKLLERFLSARDDEIRFLRAHLQSQDLRIRELEETVFRHVGIIKDVPGATASQAIGLVQPAKGWREQRAMLEAKHRPPELEAREKQWRQAADVAEQGVKEDAG